MTASPLIEALNPIWTTIGGGGAKFIVATANCGRIDLDFAPDAADLPLVFLFDDSAGAGPEGFGVKHENILVTQVVAVLTGTPDTETASLLADALAAGQSVAIVITTADQAKHWGYTFAPWPMYSSGNPEAFMFREQINGTTETVTRLH